MIKGYIKKIIKEILQEDLFVADLTKYEVNNYSKKDTIWKTIQTQEVEKYEFKINYIDDNEQEMEHRDVFNTASELNQFVEKDYLKNLPGDVRYVKDVYLYIWYYYKGDNKLESKLFTKFGNSYDPSMLKAIYKEISAWFYKHPEYLL